MIHHKLLLHICCAPDATIPWPELIGEGYDAVGYFYGGNIHPREEYERRAEAVKILSDNIGAPIHIADVPAADWLAAVHGFENEPEGGARCAKCFKLQLDAAATYAAANGFTHLSTTLTISPHKNVVLINETGAESAKNHGLIWVARIWRKNNGFKRSVDASRAMGLYRQNYCGCIFSIRVPREVGANDDQ